MAMQTEESTHEQFFTQQHTSSAGIPLSPGDVNDGAHARSSDGSCRVIVERARIPDVKLLRMPRFHDPRGFFSETFSRRGLEEAGIDCEFVQDNHSFSAFRGVVRGLHFQIPPFAQHKLVRVVRGSILDIAVDLRQLSPTYGWHVKQLIRAEDWTQLFIPAGFAHGFCTLEAETEVLYKVSTYYSPAHDRGIRWDDPALGIDWPIRADEALLSDKDRRLPAMAESPAYFRYGVEPAALDAAS
jgi:dTDP-4-dehydrorhamnose 3,5-epimerase